MCDTLGVLQSGGAIFAKNSDRSPNEPQVLEWHMPKTHTEKTVRATCVEIEQAKETHGHLLSRPVWLWGGEMGVNDCGVCIGNEAVFTKGPYSKAGLTGMDLLRLALERGGSAKEALEVILENLARYGQGGNCGYDHDFFYDNSFLILDKTALYVLETAGKKWAYKAYDRASISNRLSLGSDADAYFGGARTDFKKAYSEPVYTHFSGSKNRKFQTEACLKEIRTPKDAIKALRTHEKGIDNPLAKGSVKSACMHAGGLVGDHTTASMIVELKGPLPRIWATGSSTPCISLFKPCALAVAPPVSEPNDPEARRYWEEREDFHRAVIGRRLPKEFYMERDALEDAWFTKAQHADDAAFRALQAQAVEEERAFYETWKTRVPEGYEGGPRFYKYWTEKNKARK
ncbi:MAG TPA: peptidase U34 [Clostridia bacterium]|nr:peptidase U34 [Clostridia bacterium]